MSKSAGLGWKNSKGQPAASLNGDEERPSRKTQARVEAVLALWSFSSSPRPAKAAVNCSKAFTKVVSNSISRRCQEITILRPTSSWKLTRCYENQWKCKMAPAWMYTVLGMQACIVGTCVTCTHASSFNMQGFFIKTPNPCSWLTRNIVKSRGLAELLSVNGWYVSSCYLLST